MMTDNAPGVEIPGYQGRYRLTRDGRVWVHKRRAGWVPKKPQSRNSYQLKPETGPRVSPAIRDLLLQLYGEDAVANRPAPEPPPPPPEPDRLMPLQSDAEYLRPDDYPPPPPMSDAERWQQPRRVVWPVRDVFGQAIGQRNTALWVVLDGESVPRLIALSALAFVPDAAFEAAYKRRLREIELEYWRLGRLYAGQQAVAR